MRRLVVYVTVGVCLSLLIAAAQATFSYSAEMKTGIGRRDFYVLATELRPDAAPFTVVNTAVFAASLWLVLAFPGRVVRRAVRRRRGLCTDCGCPLGASLLCTECGRPHRRS